MKKYVLLGSPVSHSLSPKLHNAVFKELGLDDHEYLALETSPEDLEAVMKELRTGKYEGFSVTIPHKVEVMKYCDELSERAKRIGAVNTVIRIKDKEFGIKIFGDNTDYLGFEKSLEEKGFLKKREKQRVLILGSGGVSRAVISVLVDHGFQVTVASLHPEKKQDLVNDFGVLMKKYEELDPSDDYALVVNCTPVGMFCSPDRAKDVQGDPEGDVLLKDPAWYRSDRVYVDVIYNPRVTTFLKKAQEAGAEIVTGDRMFLWQAASQAKMFTGRTDVPVEVMENILG